MLTANIMTSSISILIRGFYFHRSRPVHENRSIENFLLFMWSVGVCKCVWGVSKSNMFACICGFWILIQNKLLGLQGMLEMTPLGQAVDPRCIQPSNAGTDAFMIEVWWNFDKMQIQIIFKAITEGPVTPLGGKESMALYGRESNLLQKPRSWSLPWQVLFSPNHFCTLQAIMNWTVGKSGNGVTNFT